MTTDGDAVIKQFQRQEGLQAEIEEFIENLVEASERFKTAKDLPEDLWLVLEEFTPKDADYDNLKRIRQGRMNRVSDEALIEFDYLTILMRSRWAARSSLN